MRLIIPVVAVSVRDLTSLFISVVFAGVFAGATVFAASDTKERTHEYEFDNGLKLIVQEDHRAPVAVVQIWYRVGSSYEFDGITGISHALEHMMFKGTTNLGPGKFSELVASKGGQENAFTSTDYTAYFQTWAAENVPLSFELEADRMRNLLLLEEEFKNEIRVVLEERRLRTDDNPQALLGEAARATAFQTSPYRQPVIGWAADIQSMTVEDLADWYRQWYAPNNATVVVVGDVDPQEVYEAAKTHLGVIDPQPINPPKNRPEVPQKGRKDVTITNDKARVPYLLMSYKTPTLTTIHANDNDTNKIAVEEWEIYALDVLASTLDGGDSARLPKNLIREKRIAAQVSAGYNPSSRLTSLFSFSGSPSQGRSLEELEQAISGEIAALKASPPSELELRRIKTQVVADTIYERDSMFYQGLIIGTLESVGLDWRLYREYVDKINAVTPAQVQAVAQKFLTEDRLTVAKLLPEPAELASNE